MTIKKVKIVEWKGTTSKNHEDFVCVENNYELYINSKFISNLIASPNNLRELGVGYAISEGYLKPEDINGISNIDIDKNNNKIIIMLNARKLNKKNLKKEEYTNIKLTTETIYKIMNYMSDITGIWKITGGTHWACLFDLKGKEIITIEDIGRHNAVDKVIGYSILNSVNLNDKILVSSGRLPYIMVKKAVNAKIPIMVSKSPPTDKGVELAKNNNMILIGFARKDRFTVYNGFERIVNTMENNILFTDWTFQKRNLKDFNQLKKDIIRNFEENNLKNKKIIAMLSGGKDSSTALALAKDLSLNVCLCVHFVHKWSWDISREQAKKIANKFKVPIVFYDITEDLKKRTKGAKGGSICRICKDIMKDKVMEIAEKEGAEIILTGDTALEKISGPILQYLREKYGYGEFDKMELTPVPKRYKKIFFRPLIRCGYDDVIKLKNHYGVDIERIHEVGDKFGYWREGCPLQYCDYDTTITEELLDKLYSYNKKITDLARKHGFRASIKLPSKELMVVPHNQEYLNMIKKLL